MRNLAIIFVSNGSDLNRLLIDLRLDRFSNLGELHADLAVMLDQIRAGLTAEAVILVLQLLQLSFESIGSSCEVRLALPGLD